VLPDLLPQNPLLLFCGTAAGRASAARGHYYAGPGNRFWQMLAETRITPHRMQPQDDHLLPGYGIGLTDLAKAVAGMDRDIPPAAYLPQRLAALISGLAPRIVAFTSLTAARLALSDKTLRAGPLAPDPRWPKVALWALPSLSGAARGSFSAQPWHALAAAVTAACSDWPVR
jgi:double-stranded uracil-DNA glycosylase